MAMRMTIPIEDWPPARAYRIRCTGRLLYLKVWRPDVIAMLVLIIAIGVWITRSMLIHDIVLWSDISVHAAMSYAIVGPLCAALAAWSAGQDARRKMTDQLTATPRPLVWHDTQVLLSGVVIGLIGYGGVVTVILVWGAVQATWGRPYGLILLSGLPWVILTAVLGAMLGARWSNRYAPMMALVATGAIPLLVSAPSVPNSQVKVPEHFSLWTVLTDGQYWVSEWRTVQTMPSLVPITILGWGVVALAAAVFLLRRTRSLPVLVIGAVSLVASASGALPIMLSAGDPLWYHPEDDPRPASTFQYECRAGSIVEVCMHPAYAGAFDEAVAVAEHFYEPVAGLPGVPATIWQVDLNDQMMEGHITFSLQNAGYEDSQMSNELLLQLLPLSSYFPGDTQDGQIVIGEWLIQRVTGSGTLSHRIFDQHGQEMTDPHREELAAAVDRFAALPDDERRAWLEANWEALRTGELTLEDLP